MKSIPNPGTYPAGTAGQMVVYETENGALCVAIPVKITGGTEVAWQGKHTETLVKSDGTLRTKAISSMKKIFGWDGIDPFTLEDMDTSEVGFEIVGEHSAYTPPGETEEITTFKIQWVNPVGGSTNMPEQVADRKAILAKYGSKFKALSGSTGKTAAAKPIAHKAKPAPEPEPEAEEVGLELPKAKPAPAKPAMKGPPGHKATAAVARTSIQEEVWDGLIKARPDDSEDDNIKAYYKACDSVVEGSSSDPSLLDTPAKWGAVADALGI